LLVLANLPFGKAYKKKEDEGEEKRGQKIQEDAGRERGKKKERQNGYFCHSTTLAFN